MLSELPNVVSVLSHFGNPLTFKLTELIEEVETINNHNFVHHVTQLTSKPNITKKKRFMIVFQKIKKIVKV